MSGTIAWQNYRFAADRALHTALIIRESAVARHAAVVEGAQQMLATLSKQPELLGADAESCGTLLASVMALTVQGYANIFATGADGRVRCSAVRGGPGGDVTALDFSGTAWFAEVARRRSFVLGQVERGPVTNRFVLLAAYPILQDGRFLGVVAAGLPVDAVVPDMAATPPGGRVAVWLFNAARMELPGSTGAAGEAPPPEILSQLLADPESQAQTRSVAGIPYAYAASSLPGGISLLVGYRATAEIARARQIFTSRILELGLLLAAGLLAVAIGADLGVVRPIRRLTWAVEAWRLGGAYAPAIGRGVPEEVASLAGAFGLATASLTEQEQRLQASLEQQELLMQEIHHRVKNNLQIVASLLNLQASRIRVPEARAEFQSARDRVRALATLHRHLYVQGELHTINMAHFLDELCGQLFQAMGEEPGGRIALLIEAPELQMSSDQAVPLSLIVTEAVSNALKYAFPAGRHGHVLVRLTLDRGSAGEEIAELEIHDDGIGIPAGRAETETGTRDGLGIQLIRGFARQLGATLEVEQDESTGTRYVVRVPLRRTRPAEEEVAAAK
jgi:two-component sensor histidine kinase